MFLFKAKVVDQNVNWRLRPVQEVEHKELREGRTFWTWRSQRPTWRAFFRAPSGTRSSKPPSEKNDTEEQWFGSLFSVCNKKQCLALFCVISALQRADCLWPGFLGDWPGLQPCRPVESAVNVRRLPLQTFIRTDWTVAPHLLLKQLTCPQETVEMTVYWMRFEERPSGEGLLLHCCWWGTDASCSSI